MEDIKKQRHLATYQEGWGSSTSASSGLTLLLAQTAPFIFYPFLRRDMGSRIWNGSTILAGLVLIAAAAYLRLRFPAWGFLLVAPISFLHYTSTMQIENLRFLSANGNPTPEGMWSVVLPFSIFALIWIKSSFSRLREAKQTLKKQRHSKSSGVSILENRYKKAPTRRVQVIYEPLYLLGTGLLVALIFPALGSFIIYAAIPHFFWEFGRWRGIKQGVLDAADTIQDGQYRQDVLETIMRQHIQRADLPVQQPWQEDEESEEAKHKRLLQELNDMPKEEREKLLETIRGKK